MTKKRVDDVFFQLFCEKNSDGTKHLRLRGKELFQRYGFRLNEKHMYALASFLTKFPDVVSLDLSYNDIGNNGMRILLLSYLQRENTMKCLNLLHCDLSPEGLMWLSRSNFSNLKRLRLGGNKIGPRGACFIGEILKNCENLEDLDIGETDQTNDSIEGILRIIENSSLKSLNMSRIIPKTYYSKCNTTELVELTGTLMSLNNSLEVLRIQKCQFDGHDTELLVNGLKQHQKLLMLDLGANRVGDHGTYYIATWLRTRPNLIALRLPANDITTTGVQTLIRGVSFSKIRLLDLQYNKIGRDGISDLLFTIKKRVPMRMLFIWGNEMGHRELEALDGMLQVGILEQNCIDVKIYVVDGVKHAAYYPANKFVLNSYSVSEYSFPPDLKIVRNKIVEPTAKPRALINFDFIDRYPPVKDDANFDNISL